MYKSLVRYEIGSTSVHVVTEVTPVPFDLVMFLSQMSINARRLSKQFVTDETFVFLPTIVCPTNRISFQLGLEKIRTRTDSGFMNRSAPFGNLKRFKFKILFVHVHELFVIHG